MLTASTWASAGPLAMLAMMQAPPAAAQAAEPWSLEKALGTPDWLSISGSIRPRYESLSENFVAGRTGSDQIMGLQTLLGVEARSNDFALGAELMDARVIGGDDGGGGPGEVDTFELAQAYVAWRPDSLFLTDARTEVLAGRFTMDVGSRRLISRSAYRNVLSSFEGMRATWSSPQGAGVTLFAATPLSRRPDDVTSTLDNEVALNSAPDDVLFYGLHLEAPLFASFTGEAYAFGFDEEDDADHPGRNRDLTTAGLRVRRAPAEGQFDADLEWARQTGSSRASASNADTVDLDHDASMLHLEAGYTFDAPWSPRLAVQYDHASGDASPLDAENNRFDPLFGDRRFEFGPTSIFGAVARTNLASPGLRLEVKPSARWDGFVSVRGVKLDEPRDSFGGSGVRDATGASGDEAGALAEFRARYWLVPRSQRIEVGGALLQRGDFLKTAPNRAADEDPVYGYVQWTFGF